MRLHRLRCFLERQVVRLYEGSIVHHEKIRDEAKARLELCDELLMVTMHQVQGRDASMLGSISYSCLPWLYPAQEYPSERKIGFTLVCL
jgi:hypothetical protein